MLTIGVINGPNLNLLGIREPHIYGNQTLQDINTALVSSHPDVHFEFYQSNVEGELINYLQQHRDTFQAYIINPGGYSHTSIAIADCLACIEIPVIEVHISNIHSRDRSHTVTGAQTQGVITGFGALGYQLAAEALKKMIL